MKRFAREFELEEWGQVIAIRNQTGKGQPRVLIYAQPPGYEVASVGVLFDLTPEGNDKADAYFKDLDLDQIREALQVLVGMNKKAGSC
ncbi:conserved hypothetical protein (plasmid) [Thioalkalivibrio sp. K90mix]|uniref:hypothetical protein n=1 Tax=Thioalkalivibrio sp. (strain K90mix) TaxID=396595 RepID=UPI000195ABAA|nr:hypothetical protein [Thioalkalivibrio sp. K90mix]ADC73141.1 conserved hypothetical protein [Thioalkalivibrio sp. K90mix]